MNALKHSNKLPLPLMMVAPGSSCLHATRAGSKWGSCAEGWPGFCHFSSSLFSEMTPFVPTACTSKPCDDHRRCPGKPVGIDNPVPPVLNCHCSHSKVECSCLGRLQAALWQGLVTLMAFASCPCCSKHDIVSLPSFQLQLMVAAV